jgi:hypothetical protein
MEFHFEGKKWRVQASGFSHQVPSGGGPGKQGVTFTSDSGVEYHGFLPLSQNGRWPEEILCNELASLIAQD